MNFHNKKYFPVKLGKGVRPNIKMLKWCKENCTGRVSGNDQIGMAWLFENEEDAIAFKLRWI